MSTMDSADTSPRAQISEIASYRARLWDAGFRPVAIYNFDSRQTSSPGKAPKGDEWTERNRRTPPVDAFAPPDPDALNTGILADGLRAIDVDLENLTLSHTVRSKAFDRFGEAPMRYRDNSGRCLLLYRAAEGEPRKRVISGTFGKVEVLGHGQQFVARGTHPSGADLRWLPEAPGDITADHLPAVTEEQIGAFLAEVAPIIDAKPERNGTDRVSPQTSGHGLRGDTLQVVAALSCIPNDGPADWEAWNRIGMATWAATGGSTAGLAAFHAWSEQHPAYDATETDRRWQHYATSPPTAIGAGTLFHMARGPHEEPPPPSEGDYGEAITETSVTFVEPSPEPSQPIKSALWSSTASWIEADIKPRPWIVPGYLLRGSVTLLVGAGAAGKSSIVKAWAVAGVCVLPFGRFTPKTPLRILSYNVEDDHDEERRRLSATLRQFDRTPADLAGNLMLVGPNDIGTLLERDANTGKIRLTAAMSELTALIAEFRPDVVFLDPVVELHTSEENDNTGLRAIVAQLRTLARTYNCALCLLHHTRKGATAPGDPDTARGASSIVGAARIVFTLCGMSEVEAQDSGIAPALRKHFFRLDGAKMNYTPEGDPEWFERTAYTLDNNETIAASVPWTAPGHTPTGDDYTSLIQAIGLADPPVSPRLSNDLRSFATLCDKFSIIGRDRQRKTLSVLKSQHGISEAPFTRAGKAKSDTAIGLRTVDGQPSNAEWTDGE
jgi:hypothetical protein